MVRRIEWLPALLLPVLLCAAPAAAQDLSDAKDAVTSTDEMAEAASKIGDKAADSLLVRDLLGKEIKGSDGETVGTIDDFVVVPGGRLVAAMVKTDDDTRIAVPFAAVKVTGRAEDAGLDLPVKASEVREMDELKELADKLED